jgi:GNAT superfamily N-acetyltransferase
MSNNLGRTGTNIREASGRDIPLLAGLIRDSFREVAERFGLTPENCPTHPSFCTEEWVSSAMGKGVRYFVLELEGRPCGCAALEHAGEEVCYLERLAVLPAYRRKGYGEALVMKIIEEARAAGARRLEIGIISGQTELRAWYSRLGFTTKGRKRFENLPFEVAFMAFKM